MEEKPDRKAEVNPAARHDAPSPPRPDENAKEEEEEEQVNPAQDEPLDPLAPGGIGS